MKSLNRRLFLKTSAAGTVGAAFATGVKAESLKIMPAGSGKIITRTLGKTGIEVPVVSMGVGRCDSPAVVKGALKSGITHFDTAHVYQEGNSEKMLGEILKDYPRDSFTIATKVKFCDTKEEYFEKFNTSLERLQMDYVDILYHHAISTREKALNEVMLDALKTLKSQGKAKHIGITTHTNQTEILQAAADSNFYEVVLVTVNFKQDNYAQIREKIAIAAEKGLGIIGMKVMAGGFLDEAKEKPVNHKAALKFVLRDENVHTTVPSMLNLEQLMVNSEVLTDISLNEKEKSDLELASAEMGLYCNACRECVPQCKRSLHIPEIMRAYMYTYGYNETAKAKELLSRYQQSDNPCRACPVCTVTCPKGFNIPKKIENVSRLLNVPDDFLV